MYKDCKNQACPTVIFTPQVYMDIHNYLLAHHFIACLNISSLLDLILSWMKHLTDILSDLHQPYMSSSHHTSLWEEESNLPTSYQNSDLPTMHVPGVIMLPSLPPTYPPPILRPAMHGYQEYKQPPFHQTPPLEPPIVFISSDAADRSVNGLSQYPTTLWSIVLIQPLKIFVVKSNAL